MFPAHGGTPGLIAELAPLVLLAVGAVAVWLRSRGVASEAPGTGDEAAVEEERGESE
jgi:hypothetical protein